MRELERVKSYMTKVTTETEKPPQPKKIIDKQAAERFIRAALSGQVQHDKLDVEPKSDHEPSASGDSEVVEISPGQAVAEQSIKRKSKKSKKSKRKNKKRKSE
jgi:hypothetical protein